MAENNSRDPRSVYVYNIDPQTTEDEFLDFFKQAGRVVDWFLPRDEKSNKLLGYASVKFQGEECVDRAITQLNTFKLKDKCVWISKASREKKSVDAGSRIFVGHLPQDVNERDLYNHFSTSEVRVVAVPKIVRDDAGKSKGYAFVQLDSVESCNVAIQANKGAHMFGRPITVERAGKKGTGPNLQLHRGAYTAQQNYSRNLQARPGAYIAQQNDNPEFSHAG